MNQPYFSTSEFARLCGVGKHTLFHYDAIGLLQPERVEANGYRRYSHSQLSTYDLIAVLKETGMELSQIKEYLDRRDLDSFIELLRERQAVLDDSLRRLENMRRQLHATLETSERARNARLGHPSLEWCAEEYFVATPVPPETSEADEWRVIAEHYDYCRRLELAEGYLLGALMSWDMVAGGDAKSTAAYLSRLPGPADCDRLCVKPAGRYATVLHHGGYDDMGRSFALLLRFLKQKNLRRAGDFFETDLLNHLGTASPKDYILQLAIRVEEKE